MLQRQHRLASSRDFRTVFAGGRTYVNRMVVLKVLSTSGRKPSRFGFSASGKLGNAVIRNRAKRLLREAVRLLSPQLRLSGRDVVLIARPPVRDAKLNEVLDAVKELLRRSGLLPDQEQAEGST